MESVSCPNCKGCTVKQMREILARGRKKPLPQLRESDGWFKTVYTNKINNKQFMLFKFKNSVGCRSTESTIHAGLRNPTKKYARMEEKSFGAGWQFMYPHVPSNVTIHDILTDHDIENTVDMLEEERLKRFIQVLNEKFPNYHFEKWGQKSSHFCPFSGGGGGGG